MTARYRKLLLGVPPAFLLGLEGPVKLFRGRWVDAEYDALVIFPRMAGEYAFLQLEHEEAEGVPALRVADVEVPAAFEPMLAVVVWAPVDDDCRVPGFPRLLDGVPDQC